jgi:hypothetical protein
MDDADWDLTRLSEAISAVRLHTPNLTARQVHDELLAQPEWEQAEFKTVKKLCGKMTKLAAAGGGPADERTCANTTCSNAGTKRCADCREVSYCSTACQKTHFATHKPACRAHQVAARMHVLEKEGSLFVAEGMVSTVSIMQNVRGTYEGGTDEEFGRDMRGLFHVWCDAADGRRDAYP